jgi:membrane-bound inhibitor of C-type lysozyme
MDARSSFQTFWIGKKRAVASSLMSVMLVACTSAPPPVPETPMRRIAFHCGNGEEVEMRFFPEQGVGVLVRDGRTMELQQQPVASGFHYSNGPNTVRGKGDEITIEIERMVPITCTAR